MAIKKIKSIPILNDMAIKFLSFVSSDIFLKITLGLFVLQSLFFALSVGLGLPPDESYHLAFIESFTKNGFNPFLEKQTSFFFLGEISRTPFFIYHYLFSFGYALVENIPKFYIILRLVNIMMAFGTLLLTIKVATELGVSKLVRNVSVFMLANTLMFLFLSSGVSYDNLFILVSMGTILLTLRLYQKIETSNLLLLIILILIGSLTKVNYLPIGAASIIVLVIQYLQSPLKVTCSTIVSSFKRKFRLNSALLVCVGILIIPFLNRYAANLINYKTYAPDCQQVLTINQCRENRLFARNEEVFGSDRRKADKNIVEYFASWTVLMQERTYGVHSHKQILPSKITLLWINVLLILALVGTVRLWKKSDKLMSVALFIIAFNGIVLFLENLSIYQGSGRVTFVLHGRYIFSVLPIMYLIGNHYMLNLVRNRYMQFSVIVVSVVVFAFSALPIFLMEADAQWYNNTVTNLIHSLK
jgi:hypothetical protein